MNEEDKNKLADSHDAIFEGIKNLFAEHGLEHFEISSLELEVSADFDNSTKFKLADIECPEGFRKVVKIHPRTKERKVVCVKI